MKAIDLFGGERVVASRMKDLVADRLASVTEEEAKATEQALFLKRGSIKKLVKGQKRVDMSLFDKLSWPLGISLSDAFGPPHWENDETKVSWEDHKRRNWVPGKVVVACQASDGDIPLDTYVLLKAASELRA